MDGCQRRESLRCGKMSENRFKLHIEWSNIDKTDGIAELSDNGQPLLETECIEDARLLQTILNELNDEKKELKAEIEQSDSISEDIVCADIQHQLLKVTDENKELKKENEQLKKRLEHYREVEAMNGDGKNE